MDAPEIELQEDLTTVEIPVRILAREDKRLRNKVILLVKVQWNRGGIEEISWEREEDLRRDYPHLFEQVNLFFMICILYDIYTFGYIYI